jgi:hypothetical protein
MGKNITLFFTLNPYPRPSTASVFVKIILSSKWTGVSVKAYRQNWQETVPGEEKVINSSTLTAISDTLVD